MLVVHHLSLTVDDADLIYYKKIKKKYKLEKEVKDNDAVLGSSCFSCLSASVFLFVCLCLSHSLALCI